MESLISEYRKYASAHRFQTEWKSAFGGNFAIDVFSASACSVCVIHLHGEGFGELPLLLFHNTVFDLGALHFFDSSCKTFHSLSSKL